MAQDNSGKELPKGIRQRKDGRYEGRFTYQGESFTFYNKNLKELVKEMQDKKYEVEHGLYAKRQKITVDSWFHTWIEEYKKNSVKYGTYKTYIEEYKLHIERQLGKKRLADIRSEHVQRLLNGMTDKYSRSTISLVKIILNSMFKQACKNRLILSNFEKLLALGAKITVRVPLIEQFNDGDELRLIQSYLNGKNVKVEYLAYHAMGENKRRALTDNKFFKKS